MDIGSMFLSSILLFVVVYFAVRLAINPLLHKQDEINSYQQDSGLVKLRDIDILSNAELEEVIEFYQQKGTKKEDCDEYQKYATVLNELNKIGYFTDEIYLSRLDKLKKHFNVN